MIYQKDCYQQKVNIFSLDRMYFTGNDDLQNIFVYQLTLSTLQPQKGKSIDYVISWKSKGLYGFILSPQYT